MLYFMNEKYDCTGCSACSVSCPMQCIKMIQDDEGFWYPEASDKCIKCGKCERVCPSINRPVVENKENKNAYAALTKNYAIWKRSASGGAFSEICYLWGGDNTKSSFGGAAWNGLNVEERVVQGFVNIEVLCKSKYVASYVGDCYKQLQKAVLDGQKVVFCGTPCQIAGFRNYLGKDYDNLLLIDLICHGVGSPYVFRDCMEMIGQQFADSVVEYEFRAKRKTYEQDYITKVTCASGKQYYLKNDNYMQLFLSLNALRPSCVKQCKYKNSNRMGDITIADFKGLLSIFPEKLGEEMNYSTIVANTEKGDEVCYSIKKRMKTMNVPVENIVRYNPLYDHDTKLKNNRDDFFKEYIVKPTDTLRVYTNDVILANKSIKRVIYECLPVTVRKKIQSIMRGAIGGKRK